MIPLVSILWLLTVFDGNYYLQHESSGVIPVQPKPNYAVMLTQECGDLTGQYLQVTIQVDGMDTRFASRGSELWNSCPRTNFIRLFFTDNTNVYSNISSSLEPNHYWWSTSYFYVDPNLWSFGWPSDLCANVYPWEFTNGIGHSGSLNPTAFADCARSAKQVGISFGFCSFYDTGIALLTGAATIAIK